MKTSLIHISAIVQLFEIFLQARSVTSTLQLEARQSLLKILKKSQRKEAWPGRQAVLKLTTSSLSPSQSLVASFLTTYPPFESIVLLHIWQLALASDDCSLATIKNYRFDIRQFIDFHQELSVSKLLQKPKVISFLKSQANTQSKATLTRKLSSITQFAKFAQEQGWAVDAYHQILPLNQHSSVTIDQVSTQSTQPKSTLPNHSGFFSNLKKSLISPTFSRNKSHNFPGCWQLPLDHLLQNQALNSQPNSNQSPSHNQPTSQSISSSQPSKPTALHFQDARTRLNQRLLSLSQQFAQTQKKPVAALVELRFRSIGSARYWLLWLPTVWSRSK